MLVLRRKVDQWTEVELGGKVLRIRVGRVVTPPPGETWRPYVELIFDGPDFRVDRAERDACHCPCHRTDATVHDDSCCSRCDGCGRAIRHDRAASHASRCAGRPVERLAGYTT